MTRNVILAGIAVVLLAGLYASRGAVSSMWDMVVTGSSMAFPAEKPKPVVADAAGARAPLTGFPAKFSNHLMSLGSDGSPHSFDAAKLAGVKYWAFYYSASWCPPCRAFTPDLVSFYNDFKPSHPDFELIFVNDDRSDSDMIQYMKSDAMPWPAIWYADIDNSELQAKKYCGSGIPCLVLVDADGGVLSDTFQWGQYTDPHHVIDDIRATVK